MRAFTVKQYVEENIRATNPLNVQVSGDFENEKVTKKLEILTSNLKISKNVFNENGMVDFMWYGCTLPRFCHKIRNRDELETLSGAFWVLGLNCQYIRESNSLRELEERLPILFLRTMLNSLSSPA